MLVQEHWVCDNLGCPETVRKGSGWGQRYNGKPGWLIVNLMDGKELDFCSIKCAVASLTNNMSHIKVN